MQRIIKLLINLELFGNLWHKTKTTILICEVSRIAIDDYTSKHKVWCKTGLLNGIIKRQQIDNRIIRRKQLLKYIPREIHWI